MDKPKYNIGDVVWIGEWKSREVWETCPDCGGTKTIKVVLWDNTEYIVPCETCARGYLPCGQVMRYGYKATAKEQVIQGVEMGCFSDNKGQWTYRLGYEIGSTVCSYHSVKESEIFLEEQPALNFALAKGRQLEIREQERVLMKEKPAKTWAWHVTYHRREITRLERDLEHHRRKLENARVKAKEAK